MTATILQYLFYMALLVGLAFPLGLYITKVMNGERIPGVSKVLTPCENLIYKVMRVKADEQMGWKKYLLSVVLFNLFANCNNKLDTPW